MNTHFCSHQKQSMDHIQAIQCILIHFFSSYSSTFHADTRKDEKHKQNGRFYDVGRYIFMFFFCSFLVSACAVFERNLPLECGKKGSLDANDERQMQNFPITFTNDPGWEKHMQSKQRTCFRCLACIFCWCEYEVHMVWWCWCNPECIVYVVFNMILYSFRFFLSFFCFSAI